MPYQQGYVARAEQAGPAAAPGDQLAAPGDPPAAPAADLDALAEVIARIGDTAISLHGALRALEVNPTWTANISA